jgi:poly(hydroxyalkanoate) depolymerase family esterase
MKSLFPGLMQEATRLTRSGRLDDATRAIQRALLQGLPSSDAATPRSSGAAFVPPARLRLAGAAAAMVLDGCVVEAPLQRERSEPRRSPSGAGDFTAGSHRHGALTRAYKLYVPPGAAGRSLPLVVMLHGCTQDPNDFAAGTGMNQLARETGFFVLYPAQSGDANASRCWNWFKHNHQQRGSGEPALIADLTRSVCRQHGIDARRVFIAGLSAGGAMAAIVAAAYPELFAAVGVHSGLACGSARNVGEALQVMRSGVTPARSRGDAALQIPTIVFHGDQDHTVHPRNGEQVLADAVAGGPSSAAQVQQGVGARGRRYTRTRHAGAPGQATAEHWLVHGAGHAWSGGDSSGSFTDAHGPDASREMLRFFFEHPRRA